MVNHESANNTMVDRAMSSCQAEADISQSQRTLESSPPFAATSPFAAEDRQMRQLLQGLSVARPAKFWTDLTLTAIAGWGAFAFAVALRPGSIAMLAAFAVAVFALYRGLCFVHEISHQTSRSLPRFEAAWNMLFGYLLLIPSTAYAGVHQSHHSLSTYGTVEDPEYMPFARSRAMTIVFALQSFLIPIALVFRYLVLSPVGLIWPRFQTWLVVHASSLTMNIAYRRDPTDHLMRKVRIQSLYMLVIWAAAALAATQGYLPGRAFLLWFAVSSVASFVNTLRTLGAHAYESSGERLGREGQLLDSIDTPGNFLTELWAPVGLRYHALHHCFPGIPYHNLPAAWRLLSNSMPASATYRACESSSLAHSLVCLISRRRRRLAPPENCDRTSRALFS
jgi:fatty acid desaturase